MNDVAKLAGVSAKTVSNVINGYPHVRPTTRKRVEDAIKLLNYELNVTARNLRRGRTGMVGLALPELKLPYFAELADAVIDESEKLGLRVLIEQTNADRAREVDVLQGPLRSMTDGLIFSPLALGQRDIRLFQIDFPLVLLGERVFGAATDHVTMSNVAAASAAVQHLVSIGRRRIAMIGGHHGEDVGSAALRERGYREALVSAGLPVDEDLIRETGLWHRDTGDQATRLLIDSGIEFDAIFALNDTLAIGALRALQRSGIKVPDQVALVGFDDIEDARYTSPALSTVSPGREEIARLAVTLLERRVAETGVEVDARTPVEQIQVPYELKVRGSSVGA